MKKIFVIMTGMLLIVMCSCSQYTRNGQLSKEEIQMVNEALEPFLFLNENERTLNPISHFLTSYYDRPENLDIGKFICYMPRDSFVKAEDKRELEKLRELELFPFKDTDKFYAHIGRISFAAVEQYLQKYMNVSLEDMINMGDALYLEEYENFYSIASDFAAGTFTCIRGEININDVTLYSKDAILTLKKDGEKYYIASHVLIK